MDPGWLFQTISGHPDLLVPETLQHEASQEGCGFVERLVSEWRDGSNRFDRDGEILFAGHLVGGEMVAVGGLNRDFAHHSGVGRLRHIYIRPAFRRRGIASALIGRLELHGRLSFRSIRLRTDSSVAARLYESRGYQPINSETATHVLTWSDLT